jgi:hypothetical protein
LNFPNDKKIDLKDANLYAEQDLYNRLMHLISEAYVDFESHSPDGQFLRGEDYLKLVI